jgi:protein-disulfide isomerase
MQCFAQETWQTATVLPGVDLTPLPDASRKAALAILRSEACGCGCSMKLAECRMKDPNCAVSRRLAAFATHEIALGKTPEAVRAELVKMASEPPPLLDPPVKLATTGAPSKGPANAKVTIVEFSDFQCPYCVKAIAQVNEVMKKFPNDVRLVFKQFPLDMHSQAGLAAEAALAAQAQGKFWELHDRMYAEYRGISRDRILAWAKDAGMDVNRLRADLDAHKYAAQVKSETREGENSGVEGTPTFFINGKKLNATFDVETVAPLVQEELKSSK